MANIAYIRVSTKDQSTDRQYALFKERGIHIDKFFDESKSGKDTDREELKEMLKYIREDDVVYIESISRLARNTKDFLGLVEQVSSCFLCLLRCINWNGKIYWNVNGKVLLWH